MNSDILLYLELWELLRCEDRNDEIARLLGLLDIVWQALTDYEQENIEQYGHLDRVRW